MPHSDTEIVSVNTGHRLSLRKTIAAFGRKVHVGVEKSGLFLVLP